MKKTYQFTISGMTCHACEQLITMDLEEAGLPTPSEIDHAKGSLVVDIDDSQIDAVKSAIAANNKYSVTAVTPI